MRHAGLIRIRVPFLLGFKTPLTLEKSNGKSREISAGPRRRPTLAGCHTTALCRT